MYAGWYSLYLVYTLGVLASALGARPFEGRGVACVLWVAGAIGGGLIARAVARTESTHPGASAAALWPEKSLAVWASAVLAAMAALALVAPVGAYDAIGYRLPAVAQWLDAGALVWVPGDDMLRNGYPLGLEVLEAALAAATGNFDAVELLGVGFVALGAALLHGEALALGFGARAALLAAGLFALVPMHVLNAPSGYADAPFAAALIALLVLAARLARGDTELGVRVSCGVLAGFTVALKPPGIAFAGLALGAAWALRTRRTSRGEATRALLVPLLVLTPGLFFLARDIVIAHNPLYPVEVQAFGHVIFPGEGSLDGILTPDANVPKALRALPRLLRTPSVWLQLYGPARAFDERLAGLGYAFPLAGIPAAAWCVYAAVRKRLALHGLGFVLALSAVLFVLQPFSFWPRFTSWLWGPAGLAIGLGLRELARTHPRSAARVTWALVLGVGAESGYALSHVKYAQLFGLGLLDGDAAQRLADASGVSADFVRTALAGRTDVCRTAWTDGTDDANLDGVVAQLVPRPHMHVVIADDWPTARQQMAEFGCAQLIAIGQSSLRAAWPEDVSLRPARAFGFVDVFTLAR